MTRAQRGLTLSEVMVTVAIVGVLAAVAVPSFTNTLERRRVVGVANELSADLEYARSLAVSKNLTTYLATNSTTAYTISDSVGTTHKTVTLPSQVSINSGLTVTFSSFNGTADAASTFFLAGSNYYKAQVSTNIMGRVQLQCNPSGQTATYVAC